MENVVLEEGQYVPQVAGRMVERAGEGPAGSRVADEEEAEAEAEGVGVVNGGSLEVVPPQWDLQRCRLRQNGHVAPLPLLLEPSRQLVPRKRVHYSSVIETPKKDDTVLTPHRERPPAYSLAFRCRSSWCISYEVMGVRWILGEFASLRLVA